MRKEIPQLTTELEAARRHVEARLTLQSGSSDWHATWKESPLSPRLDGVLEQRARLLREAADVEARGAALVTELEIALSEAEGQILQLTKLQQPVAELRRHQSDPAQAAACEACKREFSTLLRTIDDYVRQAGAITRDRCAELHCFDGDFAQQPSEEDAQSVTHRSRANSPRASIGPLA